MPRQPLLALLESEQSRHFAMPSHTMCVSNTRCHDAILGPLASCSFPTSRELLHLVPVLCEMSETRRVMQSSRDMREAGDLSCLIFDSFFASWLLLPVVLPHLPTSCCGLVDWSIFWAHPARPPLWCWGVFFLGLSLGAATASRFVGLITSPWKALALVELAIALLALPAVVLPRVTEWIWPALGPELLDSWVGMGVKLVVSCLVVIPPSTAMGTTLPILVVALEKTATNKKGASVLVYAFNTLGGALGLLVTSAWLLDMFGVYASMLFAIGTNVTVASAAWAFRSWVPHETKPSREKPNRSANKQPDLLPLEFVMFVAGLSGFLVLALEVVGIRLLSLIVASSFQASSSVLLSVILMLGVAALVVPILGRLVPSLKWQLLLVLSLSAIGSALAPKDAVS